MVVPKCVTFLFNIWFQFFRNLFKLLFQHNYKKSNLLWATFEIQEDKFLWLLVLLGRHNLPIVETCAGFYFLKGC